MNTTQSRLPLKIREHPTFSGLGIWRWHYGQGVMGYVQAKDAPDPVINACNGRNRGDTFTGPNKPYKPVLWTENWTAQLPRSRGKIICNKWSFTNRIRMRCNLPNLYIGMEYMRTQF